MAKTTGRTKKTTKRTISSTAALVKKTAASKTAASKTAASKTAASKTTASKTAASKTTASKTTTRKTAASKTAARKTAARKSSRRHPKKVGSPGTRRILMAFSKRILDEAKGKTIAVAADDMGLRLFDIKNLKAGNRPSMDMLIRLVHTGRYAPNYLLFNQGSRKLRTNVSVRGAQVRNIHQRLRNALRARPAQELAAESGLPIQSIYQYRVDGRRPGLHIFLGLVLTGLSPNSLLLGRTHR